MRPESNAIRNIEMFGKMRFLRWLLAAVVLAVMESASVTAVEVAFIAPAQAQFFGDQQYQYRRARPQSGGFFQNFFGPFNSRPSEDEYSPPQQQRRQQQSTQQPSDSSRAPPPRKTESKGEQAAPTTSLVVMGDGMADWLAYGLEDAFSDSPEIGIVRKNKLYSGLLQYDAKGDLDWWHVGRDILVQEKADYVVMMLGLSDRQDIREKDLAKEAERKAKDQQAKDEAEKKGVQKPTKTDGTDKIVAPAPERDKKASGIVEFRSDEWEKIYSRRIDETIAALKSKGVPVFWVGLPSIRGARSTADAAYLNDLYRARAERAGVVYIDVWDGFVDEAGKYSNYGPDYEGQTRRLRSSDGVFFTKYGALKLAHYVEHELQRYMNNRATVALPSGPIEPASEEKQAARPLAGPVVPLTAMPKDSDDLLGAAGGSSAHGDAIATKVLVKGEALAAPSGRADDFVWPLGSDAKTAQPVAAVPPAPVQPNAAAGAFASAPDEKKKEERKSGSAGRLTQKTIATPKRPEGTSPKSSPDDVPRPPLPIGPSSGSFGSVR
jgi:hypothetical protein